MLTSATDKCMRRSMKLDNLDYIVTDVLSSASIHRTNTFSTKWNVISERGLV